MARNNPEAGRLRVLPAAASPARLACLLMELYPRLLSELRKPPGPASALTIAQWRILSYLSEEPVTNKGLAQAVGVSVAATSRMVDGLVERGLLVRCRAKLDKRQCHLSLSPEGKKQVLAFRRLAEAALAKRLKRLSPPNAALVADSLETLLLIFTPPSAPASRRN